MKLIIPAIGEAITGHGRSWILRSRVHRQQPQTPRGKQLAIEETYPGTLADLAAALVHRGFDPEQTQRGECVPRLAEQLASKVWGQQHNPADELAFGKGRFIIRPEPMNCCVLINPRTGDVAKVKGDSVKGYGRRVVGYFPSIASALAGSVLAAFAADERQLPYGDVDATLAALAADLFADAHWQPQPASEPRKAKREQAEPLSV